MRLARLGLFAAAVALAASVAHADPLTCTTTGYRATPGLVAAVADNALTVTWDGEKNQEIRLRFTLNAGTPTIADLSVRTKGGQWATLANNATPEFKVVSGLRRATDQHFLPRCGPVVAVDVFPVAPRRFEPLAARQRFLRRRVNELRGGRLCSLH